MAARRDTALGQSHSNQTVSNCADRLARLYRWRQQLPDIVQAAEIKEDNAEYYFLCYCKWVATTPIPVGFNNDLLPNKEANKHCCVTSTLLQYIGQHMKSICQHHPNHPDWKDLRQGEYPAWWTALRDSFFERVTAISIVNLW